MGLKCVSKRCAHLKKKRSAGAFQFVSELFLRLNFFVLSIEYSSKLSYWEHFAHVQQFDYRIGADGCFDWFEHQI